MPVAFDDAKMPERNQEMPDLSVRELKTEMDARFSELKLEIDHRFGEVGARFDAVDVRFEAIDRRFEAVDRRFEAVDRHFDRVEARIVEEADATRRHFDIVAESLKGEVRTLVEGSYARLDDHERRIQALEKRRR